MPTYLQWDYETGSIIGGPSNVPGEEGNWLPCVMPEPRTSSKQELYWELSENEAGLYLLGYWVGSKDPLDAIASTEAINQKHRELEASPILVFGELFDCDERSELRMRDAIEYWDLRPLEPGVFEERYIGADLIKIIIWTKGDNNTIELTRIQLEAIFNEMKAKRAVRGAILYANFRILKDNPEVTINDINTLTNWGI